jgi:hypothetical protein
MGGEGSAFRTLIGYLEEAIKSFPDRRTGHNCLYPIRDVAFSAFSVFHTQFPSLSIPPTNDAGRQGDKQREDPLRNF